MASEIRNQHAVAFRRKQGRNLGEAVNVVGPAVEENDRSPGSRTDVRVADVQDTGIYLFQLAKRLRTSGLDTSCASRPQPCTSNRRGSEAQSRRRSRLISSCMS
jgi:hypothetical protein